MVGLWIYFEYTVDTILWELGCQEKTRTLLRFYPKPVEGWSCRDMRWKQWCSFGEFNLGHVEFEMPDRYPSRDVHRQLDRCIWNMAERSGWYLQNARFFFFYFYESKFLVFKSMLTTFFCLSALSHFFVFFVFVFWLHWVFAAVHGLFSSCSKQGLLFLAV